MFPDVSLVLCATCDETAIVRTFEYGAACTAHYPRSGPLDIVPEPDLRAAIVRFRDCRIDDLFWQSPATAQALDAAELAMYTLADVLK